MARQVPWPRIIAEGVAIVVSILLAFGIQAWWEGRGEKSEARAALSALIGEMDQARESIRLSQSNRERRLAAIPSLVALSSPTATLASEDSILVLLGHLWGARVPVRLLPSLPEILSAGVLEPIESPSLRQGLSDFNRRSAVLVEQEQRVLDSWEANLRPYMAARSDALRQLQESGRLAWSELQDLAPAHESGVEALVRDREFQNLLLVRLDRTRLAHNLAGDLLISLDELEELARAALDGG